MLNEQYEKPKVEIMTINDNFVVASPEPGTGENELPMIPIN